MKKVYEIVITGGPCSGKTTCMCAVEQFLQEYGYKVIIVPETATEIILSGITPRDLPIDVFQSLIVDLSLEKEKIVKRATQEIDADIIILYDRGVLDCKAYISKENFEKILQDRGLTEIEIRDHYDAVLHLVTAASGAEEFYTLQNNSARFESLEEARVADIRTQNAWIGHPHLRVIDNSTSFEKKINRLCAEIISVLGLPIPIEIERKYLIEKPSEEFLNQIGAVKQSIMQSYLHSDDLEVERRIRQRGYDGVFSYYYTEKTSISNLSRIETERKISEKEYLSLLLDSKKIIRKDRYCFLFDNQYFELDIYPKLGNMAILEIELTNEKQTPVLPQWVVLIKEVTDNVAYRNANLAE